MLCCRRQQLGNRRCPMGAIRVAAYRRSQGACGRVRLRRRCRLSASALVAAGVPLGRCRGRGRHPAPRVWSRIVLCEGDRGEAVAMFLRPRSGGRTERPGLNSPFHNLYDGEGPWPRRRIGWARASASSPWSTTWPVGRHYLPCLHSPAWATESYLRGRRTASSRHWRTRARRGFRTTGTWHWSKGVVCRALALAVGARLGTRQRGVKSLVETYLGPALAAVRSPARADRTGGRGLGGRRR